MVITLTGRVRGEARVIGSTSVDYLDLPGETSHELKFTTAPDRALNRAAFDSLELDLWTRGVSPDLYSYNYENENSDSEFTIHTK